MGLDICVRLTTWLILTIGVNKVKTANVLMSMETICLQIRKLMTFNRS